MNNKDQQCIAVTLQYDTHGVVSSYNSMQEKDRDSSDVDLTIWVYEVNVDYTDESTYERV